MTKIDREKKTAVTCPTCGKELKTWGVNYFNHCGQRHSVPDNLSENIEENLEDEKSLSEDDLEDNEKLVKCEKCGRFLITNEESHFEHCGIKQSIKDNIADFDDLNGGEENEEKKTDSKDDKTETSSTRSLLSDGRASRKTRKEKKTRTFGKARKEKEKSDESEDETSESGKDGPDKEEETWVCIECDELYSDEGHSNATCPECGCEYANLWEE